MWMIPNKVKAIQCGSGNIQDSAHIHLYINRVSDWCLIPSEQLFSYIMERADVTFARDD